MTLVPSVLGRSLVILSLFGLLAAANAAHAQIGGGGGVGGGGVGGGGVGGGVGGNQGGVGGDIGSGVAGVRVDATGVLTRVEQDPTGRLTMQRLQAAKGALNAQQAVRSPLRKISLQRLEAAIERQLNSGNPVPAEMNYLAGLTRLTHVFYLPETNDVVVAGPAEPFFVDAEGEVRGIDSLRPMLQLEDLIVALRAFPPGQQPTAMIGCSIDPTTEGLARMQQFLARIGRTATPRDTAFIVNGLRQSLGMQTVSVDGVSPKTRFAQVLVSADYRMKLIGIGLERPPVDIATYIENARGSRDNALVRWFFVPDYESVRVSDDRLAMEMVGQGVKLIGANELVGQDGSRQEVGQTTGASRRFVESFTMKYAELAAKEPVYAHLRNLIDLAIAAAFIQQEDYYGRADWQMMLLGDESRLPVEVHNAPTQVGSAINAVWKGRTLMTPIGGGVKIEPRRALATSSLLPDSEGQLRQLHKGIDISQVPADQWWWD